MDMFYVNGAITVPGTEPALAQNTADPPVHPQNTAEADHVPCTDRAVQGQLSPGDEEPFPALPGCLVQISPKSHWGSSL